MVMSLCPDHFLAYLQVIYYIYIYIYIYIYTRNKTGSVYQAGGLRWCDGAFRSIKSSNWFRRWASTWIADGGEAVPNDVILRLQPDVFKTYVSFSPLPFRSDVDTDHYTIEEIIIFNLTLIQEPNRSLKLQREKEREGGRGKESYTRAGKWHQLGRTLVCYIEKAKCWWSC